ncbi:hypothetical protein [Tessaracoccus coleopterorum]|uniref:hypothetical protein n=1 Tax=Tessaracoccus coleopterorum TaxID=2714950 RepID=UPI0018D326C7|nr:hypothetical protein [Tessaracoccus coleopterorum]
MLASLVGFLVTCLAFLTRSYRTLTASYNAGDVNADLANDDSKDVHVAEGPAPDLPGPDVLGKGFSEH